MNLDLIVDVKEIIKKNEEKLFETGEAFNIISLLGMENNERYTHSAIIADLLNPEGKHGFKNEFLTNFIKMVKIDGFQTAKVLIATEEHKGNQLGTRTYLDIVIKDEINKFNILIENKIWAEDQHIQLERYAEAYKNEKHLLLYLTPFGTPYRNSEFVNYQCISYQNEIRNWITNCIELAEGRNSFVANSLKIYLNTINKITNQSMYKEMANSIQEELLKSTENFKAGLEIFNNFPLAAQKIKNLYFQKLQGKIALTGLLNTSKYDVNYFIDEDSVDPLYIGFKIKDKNDVTVYNDDYLNSLFDKIAAKFSNNLKGKSHEDWNMWYYVSQDSILNKAQISDLSIEDKIFLYQNLEKEVEIASNEFSAILEELKLLIK